MISPNCKVIGYTFQIIMQPTTAHYYKNLDKIPNLIWPMSSLALKDFIYGNEKIQWNIIFEKFKFENVKFHPQEAYTYPR